eukprot:TRINITY_DN1332_c0_g1_i10.p1 TRINITY_DN1332_c0_g1~~TRINITY_DN1332_c0_g1_i10.p1  ORF type:complete len:219 (-),score=36.90 TRINITY_DN1332_c0_g1_i10:606-1262(-)
MKRNETDRVTIQSGTENGLTLGSTIALLVPNLDQRPTDYSAMSSVPRPSHADFTYQAKYSIKAVSGGGRSSARETIGRVASGAIAEKWLSHRFNTQIVAFVSSVGDISIDPSLVDLSRITREMVDSTVIRCPVEETASKMISLVSFLKAAGDSIGGVITCVTRNVPVGLGEPCFDKLEALLAHAMLSIPATKGFEIGSGFEGTKMRGSQHNDPFFQKA